MPVLSATQENGIVFRNDLDIDIKFDIHALSNYKVVSPGDYIISLRSFQGGFELSEKLGIISPAYTVFALHEEKKHQLERLKSALLQKMFANKSGYPAVRFEGFGDEWEQCKLDDVADRFDNLRVPVTANLRKNGDTPYYGANGIQDYVDGYTHDGEYILVAEDGANNLKNYPINYVSGRIWVNNHAHVLQAIPYLASTRFLGYEIGRSNIVSLLVGGGRAKLNADALMNMNLNLPKIKEQELIADLFQKVEISITLQNYKLDNLKNLKSSLLKKMFI